jgi:hypothetical protein
MRFLLDKVALGQVLLRVLRRLSPVSFIPKTRRIYVQLHVVLTRGTKGRISYLAPLYLEQEMFQAKVVEKIKILILCSIIFFFENGTVYEIWKIIVGHR